MLHRLLQPLLPPATGVVGMPGAGSKKAPSFSGCASELLDFFTQFEDLANSCRLTSAEQCRIVLRYIDSDTKQLWKSFPECDAADYKAFKARVIDQYPGAEKGMQYTSRDLDRIVLAYAESCISTETELMAFSRQFRPVATWLVKNKVLSEHQRNTLFWKGLPKPLRRAILHRLQSEDPNYRAPPNFEKVIEAGRDVLANNGSHVNKNTPMTPRLRSARDLSTPPSNVKATPSHQTHVRATPSRRSNVRATSSHQYDEGVHTTTVRIDEPELPVNEVEELGRRLSRLNVHDPAYAGCYTRLMYLSPTTAEVWQPPAGARPHAVPLHQTFSTTGSTSAKSRDCVMCGEGHFFNECPLVEDYIRAHQIVRSGQFVTYPDGKRIYRHRGTGLLRTTIDERYRTERLPVYSELNPPAG